MTYKYALGTGIAAGIAVTILVAIAVMCAHCHAGSGIERAG